MTLFQSSGDQDGDRGNSGPVSGQLRDLRSWHEADGRAGARRRRRCVLGSTAGSGKPRIAATVARTMAGLFPGSGIGASLDKRYAACTRQAALETRPNGMPLR